MQKELERDLAVVPSFKTAIFDCDGVILKSNRIKTQAFESALQAMGEPKPEIDQFLKYHQENGGISRYHKLTHYFAHILPRQDSTECVQHALRLYADIVNEELLDVDYVEGIIETLELFNSMNINCFVNSGGDQEELRSVFKTRKIDTYFSEIYGSPSTKTENLMHLQKLGSLQKPALFFGDSKSDYDAAMKFNMEFVFIYKESEWTDHDSYPISRKYRDFDDYLKDLAC